MNLIVPCAFAALLLPAAAQATWYVDVSAAGAGTGTIVDPYQSLQFAIDAPTTLTGDTLEIAAGVYLETINTGGKDLILDGSQAASLPVIDAQGSGTVLTINSGETLQCVVRSLVLTGGVGTAIPGGTTRGGGAYVLNSQVTLEFVELRGNEAFQGGGVAAVASRVDFEDCAVQANHAEAGGGIYGVSSDVVFSRGRIADNRVEAQSMVGYGGGVFSDTSTNAAFFGVTFSGNRALYFGGGGAIYCSSLSAGVIVDDCRFEGNEPGLYAGPGSGGAILSTKGPFGQAISCRDSRFEGNGQVTEEGALAGGAVSGGDYIDCVFIGNGAQQGGAMYNATATRCVFQGNSACAGSGSAGGAAFISTLVDCDVVNNFACGQGGGVLGGALEGCRVLNNVAYDAGGNSRGEGGGIHSAIATNTRIEGNSCALGGALHSEGGGAYGSTLTGCTVLSNRADIGGGTYGGVITQSTLSGNLGVVRSGAGEDASYDSCILWHNYPADAGSSSSFVYSIVESGLQPGTGNASVNPLFFGASAADVHLQAGSPGIDTGSPLLPLDTDGSPADRGALPFDPTWRTGPASYCQPTRTFGGCDVRIEATGLASLSAGIALRATGAPSTVFGLFFMGSQPNFQLVAGSGAGQPNSLCVGGSIVRTGAIQSTAGSGNCGGEFQKAVTPSELTGAGAQVGTSLFGQFWFRQPPSGGGFGGTAMSDAIALPIVP